MMKNRIVITLLLLLFTSTFAFATKRALIIAVGKYEKGSGWPSISSKNDVPLIKNALLGQEFQKENIKVIYDAEATKDGILKALHELYEQSAPGDIVVIHYSGHGQQVLDYNGDETDGLDESIAPYDAQSKYTEEYHGQNHITDDELEIIINNFRIKLGKDGQLLFILDSCHSGTASRGDGSIRTRGGVAALVPSGWKAPGSSALKNRGSAYLDDEDKMSSQSEELAELSQYFDMLSLNDTPSAFVMISGASASELNYEYEGVGSLSYAFAKAMGQLNSDFTYRQLFGNIAVVMNGIAPRQKPVIEGDVDYKLFKGEYVKQAPYYDMTAISSGNKVVSINAGQVNRIFIGTTVLVMPVGSRQVDSTKVLAKGKVTHAGFTHAVIELEKPLDDDNDKNYWVFVDQPSFSDIAINVFLDESVKDAEVKKSIDEFLKKNSLGEMVSDINLSDVIIDNINGNYVVSATKGENRLADPAQNRGNEIDRITSQLFNYAQGNYLKNLNLNSEGYEFSFELIPVKYNPSTKKVIGLLPPKENNVNGTFEVHPKQDYVVLKINNESDHDLYFSIVEINSQGKIASFFPNSSCNLSNNERKLAPHASHIYKNCVYSFAPPYERLILKGFASDKPLNLSPAATRGEAPNNNPLEKFLKNTYVQNRGSEAEETGSAMVGGSAQFLYEIVDRKK